MTNKKAQMQSMTQPVVEKKSKMWIWILVILLLIVGSVIAFFLLSGGSSIPQPPALPE